MAVIVDLKDMGVRTPDQVLRVFYRMFDAEAVELGLWNVYAKIAVAEDKYIGQNQIDMENMALLFDQLIAFAKAVQSLMDDPPERCPVCKRIDRTANGAG